MFRYKLHLLNNTPKKIDFKSEADSLYLLPAPADRTSLLAPAPVAQGKK